MERVGCPEGIPRIVDREPRWQLRPVLGDPVAVLVADLLGVAGQHDPAIGRTSRSSHSNSRRRMISEVSVSADMITALPSRSSSFLKRVVVGLVLGAHLQLGRRDRHGQHDVVPPARFLRQVVQEAVELRRQPALAVAADVVHQLVHQDQAWPIVRKELADHVARRRRHLRLVLADVGKSLCAAQLKRDLAPGRAPERRAIAAAAAGDRIELGADEHRDLRLRHRGNARPLQELGNAEPAVCDAGRCWPGGRAASAQWVLPPPNWVVMLKTADVSVFSPDSRRSTSAARAVRFSVRKVRSKNCSGFW